MELQTVTGDFSICKIARIEQADFSQELLFVAKTPDEISLVCLSAHVPLGAIAVEDGWRAIRISGVLDFGLLGVVAKISGILADARISIFVVSTYNTDYILLKGESLAPGLKALKNNGYTIR